MKATFFILLRAIVSREHCVVLSSQHRRCLLINNKHLYYTVLHLKLSTAFGGLSLCQILAYDQLNDKTGLLYNLSDKFGAHFFLHVFASSRNQIASISKIYANALWYEREVGEFFGIRFLNSTDCRNLLLPYNFNGAPLRKN